MKTTEMLLKEMNELNLRGYKETEVIKQKEIIDRKFEISEILKERGLRVGYRVIEKEYFIIGKQ